MTYSASIEVEVDDEMFEKMEDAACQTLTPDDCPSEEAVEVYDWLVDHIHESDGYDFQAEINDIYEIVK